MESPKYPNLLILGAAKSGTTSLYYYLDQHPDVFMSPVKELRFFAYEGGVPPLNGPGDQHANRYVVTEWEEYLSIFRGATDESIRGEASPIYLYDPNAPERIHRRLPEVLLIAILRNPVDRAYSHYHHLVKSGRESIRDFEDALEAEPGRISDGWEWSWHYTRVSFYYEQLTRYLKYFDREQIAVYLFEDLMADNVQFAQRVYQWLGIDDSFVPDVSLKLRKTGVPRSQRFQRFLHNPDNVLRRLSRLFLSDQVRDRLLTLMKNRNLKKPELSDRVRAELVELYREDVLQLQELLDRDLTHWLEV
jgi:hypothetical protein